MEVTRRDFLRNASLGAACLAAARPWDSMGLAADAVVQSEKDNAYKYRVAFGAWINDMRNEPLPLEDWPAPQFDDETIRSAIMAMDVQQQAGFNYLDAFGLFATTSYPLDIVSAFSDPERRRRVLQLVDAGKQRGIKLILGMGLLSWGYDLIIGSDPAVKRGSFPHAMCGASEKSWSYVEKILDCALSEFYFGGVHLESADQGWCDCPDCAGKYGVVGYNVRINTRAADHIKSKWPDKIVTSIPINWLGGGTHRHFNDEEKAHLIELSRHIDCFMDMGHRGTYVAADQRRTSFRNFIAAMARRAAPGCTTMFAGTDPPTSSPTQNVRPTASSNTMRTALGVP